VAKLHYSGLVSVDGFLNDRDGRFDWAEPDPDVHRFVNDFQRSIGTHLYGKRMYEVMVAWETMPLAGEPDYIADYAHIWRAAEKVVYSTTMKDAASARTSIQQRFDPESIRALKQASSNDFSIGGAELAGQAFSAGLVDECHFFVSPVIVGGGTRFLPTDLSAQLELLEDRRFGNGTVYLRYRVV
jgi:dihydrofolate reductase